MKTRNSLTADDVERIVAACRAEARKHGWAVTIVVVDEAGILWRVDRGDGAPRVSPQIAQGKAYTSAMLRAPTGALEGMVASRPAFATIAGLTLVQGAVPIIVDGECLGAIGVSGVQSHEDEQVANAGLKALG